MPVTSASQLASTMSRVAEAVRKSQMEAARLASAELKASVLAVSPARLRNVGKSGAKLGVSTSVTGGATPTATGKATGPWPIIENDTPQHLIGIGKSGRKRARVTISNGAAIGGYLHAAGYNHPVRGPIVHPGTKGKQLFHKGVAAGTPKAIAVMNKTTVFSVKGAFH